MVLKRTFALIIIIINLAFYAQSISAVISEEEEDPH